MPEVVKQLSERMVRMGHKVTVLTSEHPQRGQGPINGVVVRGFPIGGNAVDGIKGDTSAYVQALRNGGFDVVTCFAAQQWATDALLDKLGSIPGRKIFVPTGFSALHDPRWAEYYRNMPSWLGAMDLNIFLSHRYQDIAFAKAHGLTNHAVIPNGAAAEEFDRPLSHDFRAAQGIAADQPMVLHIGSYTGIKGHREAIRMFLRARTGNAVLVFIGNGVKTLERYFNGHYSYMLLKLMAKLKGKRILFIETDRVHTVDALRQADLFLFPSNVECSPIVLFEAMAAGVPYLSSQAGNAEEIVEWSGGGTTIPGVRDADDRERPHIAEGAKLLAGLLNDKEHLQGLGAAGQKAWREHFTWEHIAEQYVAAYTRSIQRT
jgi:glycosyltransferase involved in cell wall biosynthesis